MTLFPDCPIAVDVVPLTAKTMPVYLRNTVLVMLRVPAPPTVKRQPTTGFRVPRRRGVHSLLSDRLRAHFQTPVHQASTCTSHLGHSRIPRPVFSDP